MHSAVIKVGPNSTNKNNFSSRSGGTPSEYQAVQSDELEADSYFRSQGHKRIPNPGDAWVAAAGLDENVSIGENVLNVDECKRVVDAAEAYFRVGSDRPNRRWMTSRHYAVPTTDVPVWHIPELLSWFNEMLEDVIFPAMEEHFQIGGRLRIFDAFLVKYDANAVQNRLPLHNDQSEYSLTIAMNPLDAYEGGGTYFCDSVSTIKTGVGGVTSFRSELLHAGKMIKDGKRYIIVCFIYI